MADLDEAAVVNPSSGATGNDLDDETQDFRFLSQIAFGGTQSTLPKRGEKDFEPHGSTSQEGALVAAQDAMRAALSQPRVHAPKAHIFGVLHVGSDESPTVLVATPKTVHFRTMGRADSTGAVHLSPEEAIYLLERGSLEIRSFINTRNDEGSAEVSISLQSAYALLTGPGGVSIEEYAVYAGLKRSGYIVIRPSKGTATKACKTSTMANNHLATKNTRARWFHEWFTAALWQSHQSSRLGPIVKPGLYRTYGDIYSQLAIIPFHDPSSGEEACHSELSTCNSAYPFDRQPPDIQCTFWVWKPSQVYKKSAPGAPDYRIVVVDARETDVLTLENLNSLLSQTPLTPPTDANKPQMYQRLRQGWRSVIIAVVDCGIVSYIRVADAAFGGEHLYRNFGTGPTSQRGKKRG